MGRKKLNKTKEELNEMNRIRRNRYYEKHKEEEKEKSLDRYYKSKQISYPNFPFSSSML